MKSLQRCKYFVEGELPVMVVHSTPGTVEEGELYAHDFSEIVLVTGKGTHLCGGKRVPLRTGDLLVIGENTVHGYADCGKLELYTLMYDALTPLPMVVSSGLPLVKLLYPGAEMPPRNEALPVGRIEECDFSFLLNLLMRLRYEIRHKRIAHKLIVPALFMEVIGYFSRGYSLDVDRNSNWRPDRVLEYLNAHCMEKLTVRKLAAHVGMSDRNLFRYFRERFDMGPMEYVLRIRLFRAMELLQTKTLSVSEVAYRTGFCDSNYLCKLFKREYGITPKKFMRSAN